MQSNATYSNCNHLTESVLFTCVPKIILIQGIAFSPMQINTLQSKIPYTRFSTHNSAAIKPGSVQIQHSHYKKKIICHNKCKCVKLNFLRQKRQEGTCALILVLLTTHTWLITQSPLLRSFSCEITSV